MLKADPQRAKSGDRSGWAIALLALLFIVLYLAILGVRPLFIPDEFRYGEIAREMLVTGNWIVPRLDGLLYFEKPPFGHWINAISLLVFGENPFAVRFASALSAGASALIVAIVAHHLCGARRVTLIAVFVFLTMFQVQAISTFSVLDAMFSAALNAGIAAFALGTLRPATRNMRLFILAGGFFGIAFLIKGMLAFVLPVLVIVPWLLIDRRLMSFMTQGIVTVVVAVVVMLPWSIAIHLQQPDFWHYFIWVEHLQRFAGENAQHGEPFYYYLAFAPAAAFPWFGLLPAMVAGWRKPVGQSPGPSGLWLLVFWCAMPFVFFSIANGKLITYILPCFVPLAILMAHGLNAAASNSRRLSGGLAFIAAVYVIMITALVLAQNTDLMKTVFAADDSAKFLALTGALSLAALLALVGLFARSPLRFLAAGASIVPFLIALPFVLPERVMHSKAPEAFLTAVAADLPANAFVATDGFFLRAVTWSLKRQDVYVIGAGGETQYGLDAADGAGRQLTPARFAEQITGAGAADRDFLLLCRLDCPLRYARSLPHGTTHESYGNFHAWRYRANDH